MTFYLSNRDGEGKTSEEGHYRFQTKAYTGHILKGDDLKVKQNTPQGMSVIVSKGDFRIPFGEYAYTGWLNTDQELAVDLPDAANPRIDTVILYVDRNEETSPSPPNNPNIVKLLLIKGDAASSPTPVEDSVIQSRIIVGNPFIRIANITVNVGSNKIVTADIEDIREKASILSELIKNSENIVSIVNDITYPVGSVYINATDTRNPATILKVGTWAKYAEGRVLAGHSTSDADFDTVGKTGGAKTHQLTTGQLPQHGFTQVIHGQESGTDIASMAVQGGTLLGGSIARYGNHPTHTGASSRQNPGARWGSNQAHNNMQPYITVYMWRRVS